MKSILKVSVVTVLAAVALGTALWGLGFTVSLRPTVKAQSLSPIYLPLVMKNYAGVTEVRLESDRSFCSSLTVVGELKNYAATYYTSGPITVNLYDSEGVLVGECSTYRYFAYSLAPGDVTAFSCTFGCLPTREWSYYTVDFSPHETYYRPLNLVVSGVAVQDNGRRLLVQGIVTNEDVEIANYPTVWITLYDVVGDVVNVGEGYAPARLYPGESSIFSFEVCGPVAGYTDYAVRAYGEYWGMASEREPHRKGWQEWRVSQGE